MDSTTDHFTAWTPATVSAFQTSQVLTTAVMLARAGIPVFPCAAGGKQPLTTHGFQDASSDPAELTAWWRRWPDANLGLPTGRPSGVDVVDIDVHPAGSGFAAFERACAGGYANGWAWLVRTPSGGVHAIVSRELLWIAGVARVREAKTSLSEALQELRERGLIAFGGRDRKLLNDGGRPPSAWTVAVIEVTRVDRGRSASEQLTSWHG
jgi:hypothetical protein